LPIISATHNRNASPGFVKNSAFPTNSRNTRATPVTRLSPPELKALHPLGAAPLIEVDGMLLAESAAVVEFIHARYGRGRLQHGPGHPDFASDLTGFTLPTAVFNR